MAKGRGKSRRIRSASSEMNGYLNELKANGYLIEMSAAGHWKIYLRCGRSFPEHHGGWHCRDCSYAGSTSASPSDRNTISKLRRDVGENTKRILERRNESSPGVVT